MKKKKKKSELIGLTLQTRLTRKTWDSRHESLITKYKTQLTGLPRINWVNPSNQVNPSSLGYVS